MEEKIYTSRTHFNRSWLSEMPMGVGTFENFPQLVYNINDLKKSPVPPTIIDLGNNLKKIEAGESIYYWYEINNEIIIGCELEKQRQAYIVRLTGKNPKFKGKQPFASDLYNTILKDAGKSIRLLSDEKLSDEGYNIWVRLFNAGHKISIYDRANPANTFKTFDSLAEFESYFKKGNPSYQRYQYVLSENNLTLVETRINFRTRSYHELNNLGLIDYGEPGWDGS